jgi:hypothetical protein
MDYQLCCLDLTRDGKTLVDTEVTKVSDLWIAPAGDTAKATQITPKRVCGWTILLDARRTDCLCQRRWQSTRRQS